MTSSQQINLAVANVTKELLCKMIDKEAIDLKVANHGVHTPADTDKNMDIIIKSYNTLFEAVKSSIK